MPFLLNLRSCTSNDKGCSCQRNKPKKKKKENHQKTLALLEEPARPLVGVVLEALDGRVGGRGVSTASAQWLGDSAARAGEAESSRTGG
jgi:hypothetical protein